MQPEEAPFFTAVSRGHLDVVKFFVANGMDINGTLVICFLSPENLIFSAQQGQTSLATAIDSCQIEMVRFLLQCGATVEVWSNCFLLFSANFVERLRPTEPIMREKQSGWAIWGSCGN